MILKNGQNNKKIDEKKNEFMILLVIVSIGFKFFNNHGLSLTQKMNLLLFIISSIELYVPILTSE